jgi:hypothetical protein
MEKMLASQSTLLERHIQDDTGRRAVEWLSAPDVWKNLRDALSKRQPGTGDWFISSDTFQSWLSAPQFLWLTGIPGAGKTILSSAIIATLLRHEEGSPNAVLFSFFDFQNAAQQESDALLRSMLMQLALRSPEALGRLRELYGDCAWGSREPSSVNLFEAVTDALTHFPKAFVIVDALDECSDRRALLQNLKALSTLPNVHIIALSRRERDIELALESVAHEIPLTTANVDKDITMYVKHRMSESDDMRLWSPGDRQKVQEHLTSKAHGMYVL